MTEPEDPFDPVARAYRQLWLKVKALLAILLLLLVAVLVVGVPHLQGTFYSPGLRRQNGYIDARHKSSAWYVSVTGWRKIDASYTNYEGLPVVLFVPVGECFELRYQYPFITTTGK
jgi:hypothetical protein